MNLPLWRAPLAKHYSKNLHYFCCKLLFRVPFGPYFHLHTQFELIDNGLGDLRITVTYNRADLLRILRITARQLAGWEKAELVAAGESYSFFDLLQIKKVRDLCARKVRPAMIRESLAAMQKQAAGMENPLLEAGAFSTGRRVAFRHQGKVLEPIAGQFMFDFSSHGTVIASRTSSPSAPSPATRDAAELFAQGIALEEDPSMQAQAILVYQKVLDLDPGHAAANINLGTLHYNRQEYIQAEVHYRRAIAIDPRYALAYFDLGNVLDETGRVLEAIQAYSTALQLAPTYGDAHYNVALAYEKIKEPRKALKHWQAYVRLDTTGPWAVHARNQIKRILQADGLKLVANRG
jgi:tetratricopeptide (TPR) repeat protein